MNLKLSQSFYDLLDCSSRYLVLCGGAGSGKTEFAARKLFIRSMNEGKHRFLVLRKVRSRVNESVVAVFRAMLAEAGIVPGYNHTERVMTWQNPMGDTVEVLFDGLDDPEKIKSIKGITSIWLEEATEFTKHDFLQIDLRLREPGPGYHQIILSFNPDAAVGPWLKERFFDHVDPNATVHRSTIIDNPIADVREKYMRQLADLKGQDETMYAIYALGEWAAAKGKIYNWDVRELPNIRFDEVFYGGDFGYAVNPSVCVRIYRKADEFWVQEVVYQDGLTNPELAEKMRSAGIGKYDPVYFDASEPKSIEEIYRAGFNVKPCDKGPDSVRAGIIFLKSKTIHIVAGSEHIIRESHKYSWKMDKNELPLPEPVKFDDHAMDAIRYGITTHCKRPDAVARTISHSVYPD